MRAASRRGGNRRALKWKAKGWRWEVEQKSRECFGARRQVAAAVEGLGGETRGQL